MPVMIKLQLPAQQTTFDAVRELPGLRGLQLDRGYGLVCLDPKAGLFVVRADNVDRVEQRRALSPEILEFYGDTRISTTDEERSDG